MADELNNQSVIDEHGQEAVNVSGLAAALQQFKTAITDEKVDKVSGKGLSTEDFTTALQTKLTQLYSKAEIDTLVEAIKQFDYEVAASLPTASADTMGTIYLIPSTNAKTQNAKDEFITLDNGAEAETRYTWEQIGTTTVDLSGYALQSEMSVAPGTGTDADKTTIQLKNGTSATVLTAHQDLSGYKTTQSAVSDPSADGTGITFIDSISQNANGVITPHKKTVQNVVASDTSTGTAGNDGLMTAAMAEKLNGIDAAVGNIIIPLQIIQKAGLITGATETIVDNPEFCTVLLDADDKIVMGIRHDLTVVGADVEDAFEFVMEQL